MNVLFLLLSFLCALTTATPASAIHPESAPEPGCTVEGIIKIPQRNTPFSYARVMLYGNHGLQYTALLRKNGGFALRGVEAGSYTLEVDFPGYFFAPVMLEVKDMGRVLARTIKKEGLRYPLVLRPASKAQYFASRPPWNLKAMLLNPTVIMMAVMGFMVFAFPKLVDATSEEQKRQATGKKERPPAVKG